LFLRCDCFYAARRAAAAEAGGDLIARRQLCGVANDLAIVGPLCQAVSSSEHAERAERIEPAGVLLDSRAGHK
jgi:hypothetical protein